MNLRYQATTTPRTAYVVFLDEKMVALVSRTRSGQWVANTTSRPHLSVPACGSRHEATMALIGKLTELGVI